MASDAVGYPRDVVPTEATARRLAAGDPAALEQWRRIQVRAAADPTLGAEADYVVSARSGPPLMAEWRICPGCNNRKCLDAGERMCPPCVERGATGSGGRGGYEPGPVERQRIDAERAYAEYRARLRADDPVPDGDTVLEYLKDHTRIRHEYR
jgi:hypothetical protein